MLSKDLEQTLNDAFRAARARRHEFMTVEHLLLALLAQPLDLAVGVGAAGDDAAAQPRVGEQLLRDAVRLERELARRAEHERLRLAARAV